MQILTTIRYRRIGEDPFQTPHEETFTTNSHLETANQIGAFARLNQDAEIVSTETRPELPEAFIIQGYLLTFSGGLLADRHLALQQHLELSLCEFLDNLHIPVDECQIIIRRQIPPK